MEILKLRYRRALIKHVFDVDSLISSIFVHVYRYGVAHNNSESSLCLFTRCHIVDLNRS